MADNLQEATAATRLTMPVATAEAMPIQDLLAVKERLQHRAIPILQLVAATKENTTEDHGDVLTTRRIPTADLPDHLAQQLLLLQEQEHTTTIIQVRAHQAEAHRARVGLPLRTLLDLLHLNRPIRRQAVVLLVVDQEAAVVLHQDHPDLVVVAEDLAVVAAVTNFHQRS